MSISVDITYRIQVEHNITYDITSQVDFFRKFALKIGNQKVKNVTSYNLTSFAGFTVLGQVLGTDQQFVIEQRQQAGGQIYILRTFAFILLDEQLKQWTIFETEVLFINKKWVLGSTQAYSGLQEGQKGKIITLQKISKKKYAFGMHFAPFFFLEIFCMMII